MKVFIDLGAYNGDTIEQFYNWIKLIDDPEDYEIWAFEPNPDLYDRMYEVSSRYANVNFLPWAAWTFDGQIDFAVDKAETPMGSTLEKSKKNIWTSGEIIQVKCFDFSKWLTRFNGHEVYIKMDIEGAEFGVLGKMIKDRTINIPNILLVEFHANKAVKYETTDTDNLIDRCKKMGVNIKSWH